jgi:hypothetical protein
MPSQRENTKLLTADELTEIQALLGLPPIPKPTAAQAQTSAEPQVPASKPERQWQGTTDGAYRDKMIKELRDKLADQLRADLQTAKTRAAMPKVDLTILEAAGGAAKAAVDEVFGAWTALAPLASATKNRRQNHQFTARGTSANIVDVADLDARARGRMPVNGHDTAKHIAANDQACRKVMADYSFDPYTGTPAEKECLSDLLDDFYKKNKPALDECDRFGYWMASPDLGMVFAPRYLNGWAGGSYDVKVVWDLKAHAYRKLIHEYIHVLQHPVVPRATSPSDEDPPKGTNTIKEGVCEYLTTKVMAYLAQKRTDTEWDAIALKVEDSPTDRGRGAALKDSIQNYVPAYTAELAKVKDAITLMGGDHGLLAAFFQGHTEYIGRYYSGNWLDGVLQSIPGGPRSMPAPETFVAPLDALAAATGLDAQEIRRANPHLASVTDLAGQQIYLDGFHAHLMVVDPTDDQDACETWEMIAAQHDVAADRIKKANGNPADPPAKRWILVPNP